MPNTAKTRVRNDLFDARRGLDRGRTKLVEALWYLVKCALFLSPLPFPSSWKCRVLRLFGAQVGRGVVIKPRVNIHFPWKLCVGDFTWIGEEVFILNFEAVSIGAQCCLSQRVFLCTGNHDYRSVDMPYRNRPITIEDGAWVGAQAFVAPEVTVGSEAVIGAGSVVTRNQPRQMVCSGNPCVPRKPRWPAGAAGCFSTLTTAATAVLLPSTGTSPTASTPPRPAPPVLNPPAFISPRHADDLLMDQD